jgi:dTMP kinase
METMALLFAADRVDHLEHEILPNLRDNITVICDRYLHSSLAYQSLTAGEEPDEARRWVEEINCRARQPDQVLVLDLPAEEAARRRASRGGAEEMYEYDELQERLVAFYRQLPELYPGRSITMIDGDRSIEQVHGDCLSVVLEATC